MILSCKWSIRWLVELIRRQVLRASTLAFNKKWKGFTLRHLRKSLFEDNRMHKMDKMQRIFKEGD